MTAKNAKNGREAGFSLIELMIAMTVTLVIMGIASTMLAASFRVRSREDRRSDAIADVQRGLNIMSREIASSGFGTSSHGIVTGDSDANTIRVRSDLDDDNFWDADEDVKYSLFIQDAADRRFLIRYDVVTGNTTVLANRVDSLDIVYNNMSSAGALTTSTAPTTTTTSVTITIAVTLPAVGTPNAEGYQPASQMRLVSTATLRNAALNTY